MRATPPSRLLPTLREAHIPGIAIHADALRPVTTTVVGTRDSVAAVIRGHNRRGTLVEHGVQIPLRDGRVKVQVTYLQSAAEHAAACAARRPRWKVPAVVAGVAAATVVAGWLLYLAVTAILQSLPVIAALAIALLLVPAAVAGIRVGCRGMHCDGCG